MIIIGVLARALTKYGAQCIGFASSHYHLLLQVDSALQLARTMNFFNSKLAKEIGRLTGWREKIWSRRYQAIPVSQEEAAQIARLKYILSHGVRENLVARLRDWPGVHAVRALLDGEALQGRWFDRTQEYAARRRGEKHDRLKYSTPETLTLEPLPCWRRLEPEQRKKLIASITRTIVLRSSRRDRRRSSTRPPSRCAASSGASTPSSSAGSATPPRSSGREIARPSFRLDASHRPCRSCLAEALRDSLA